MFEEYRILVCGSREWVHQKPMATVLKRIFRRTIQEGMRPVIIHGGARGADILAGIIARECRVRVHIFPAKWERYGRAAGPIRNSQMLEEGKPHLVLAFHDDIANSKGTKDMVNKSNEADVKTLVFRREDCS